MYYWSSVPRVDIFIILYANAQIFKGSTLSKFTHTPLSSIVAVKLENSGKKRRSL